MYRIMRIYVTLRAVAGTLMYISLYRAVEMHMVVGTIMKNHRNGHGALTGIWRVKKPITSCPQFWVYLLFTFKGIKQFHFGYYEKNGCRAVTIDHKVKKSVTDLPPPPNFGSSCHW